MILSFSIHGIGNSRAQRALGPGCPRRCKLGSSALMVSAGLSARILANHGQYRDAEQLVRSAVALAAQTDLLSERADTLLELSRILTVAGQFSDARSIATQAPGHYQHKGNLPGTRESLRCLTQSAPV
jgi:hypothetical protein